MYFLIHQNTQVLHKNDEFILVTPYVRIAVVPIMHLEIEDKTMKAKWVKC